MKKFLKRAAGALLALCMAVGAGSLAASAADGVPQYADDFMYSAKLRIVPDDSFANFSLGLFDTDCYINVNHKLGGEPGYNAHVKVFTVETVPKSGEKNIIKDLVLTYDGVNHHSHSASFDQTERTFDLDAPVYGIKAGDYLMASYITISTKTEQVQALEQGVPGYYEFNDGTHIDATFYLSDFQLVWQNGKAPAAQPDETAEHSLNLSAEVAAAAPDYSFSIPESVDLGTLSAEQDNEAAYTVKVTAENLGAGRIVVSAPDAAVLTSGENRLNAANRFGTQETSVSAELPGTFAVAASDVAAAAAGSYTGSVTFTVSYFAEK